MSGFWDSLFPGGTGELVDNLLNSTSPTYGLVLSESSWVGTEGDDTEYFINRFFNFNPYQSSISLLGGNDAIEFGGICSGVKVDLGGGDQNVFKANSQVRFSTLLGGEGSDLFLLAQGGMERGSMFISNIDAGSGNDLIIIEKDETALAAEDANIVGSSINAGEGNDVVGIQGFGVIFAPGDYDNFSQVELGAGDDSFYFVQSHSNAIPISVESFHLDAGAGNDIIDISLASVDSIQEFNLTGGQGYDELILPAGVDVHDFIDLGFESIKSGENVLLLNNAPQSIALSAIDFSENIAAGSVVATLNTLDPDSGDTFTYSFATGVGDADNNAFSIDGIELKIDDSPDFETKSSYSIRLQATDSGGLTVEQAFTLTVNDLAEGPQDIDGDGFVDEITNYQMWTASGGVDLTNRRGRTYSDSTSRKWDAIKAVEADNEFSVLVEGHLSKEGKYKVVTADDEGVIVGATRWLNGNRMRDSGYEEVFSMDFNGNGVVDLV